MSGCTRYSPGPCYRCGIFCGLCPHRCQLTQTPPEWAHSTLKSSQASTAYRAGTRREARDRGEEWGTNATVYVGGCCLICQQDFLLACKDTREETEPNVHMAQIFMFSY